MGRKTLVRSRRTLLLASVILLGATSLFDPGTTASSDQLQTGHSLLSQGHPKEAEQHFRKMLTQDSSNIEARIGLIHALLAQNRFPSALSELETAKKQAPSRADLDRLGGLAFYRAGDYPMATRLLTRFLQKNPRDAEIHYYLGRILLSLLNDQTALGFFDAAADLDPTNGSYHHYRGVALRRLGRLEEAMAALQKARKLSPDQAGPSLYMGWIALERGDLADAETYLREATQLNTSLPQAHFRLGLVYIKQREFESAAIELQKAIERFPEFDLAWYNLGKCYARMGKEKEAEEAFTRFRQLAPISDRISELRQTLARSPGDMDAQRELRDLLLKVEGTSLDVEHH